MKSTDKVKLALDRIEALSEDPDQDPTVLMAAGMLSLSRGLLERLLPADPDELDELVDRGVEWMQSLRSDPELAA